jgi:hypothetical protein
MSLNAATAAPSGHFLVSRKKPSVIAQTHLISVSFILTNPFLNVYKSKLERNVYIFMPV